MGTPCGRYLKAPLSFGLMGDEYLETKMTGKFRSCEILFERDKIEGNFTGIEGMMNYPIFMSDYSEYKILKGWEYNSEAEYIPFIYVTLESIPVSSSKD